MNVWIRRGVTVAAMMLVPAACGDAPTKSGGGNNGTANNGGATASCSDACTNLHAQCPADPEHLAMCPTICEEYWPQAVRNCSASAATCPEIENCRKLGRNNVEEDDVGPVVNNPNANNATANNGTSSGGVGSACLLNEDCGDNYCKTPAGATEGKCAINDFGKMCQENTDCEYGACLYRDIENDAFGYCTSTCQGLTDCPKFWGCEEVGNAGGTYCQQS